VPAVLSLFRTPLAQVLAQNRAEKHGCVSTYAQNQMRTATSPLTLHIASYKSHSIAKLLIYIESFKLLFFRAF
jgi:hypothetical protein